MNEKYVIGILKNLFFIEFLLKLIISFFVGGSKQQEKTISKRNIKLHILSQVSCPWEFHCSFWLYLVLVPPDDVLSIIADLSPYFPILRKKLIWKLLFKYTYWRTQIDSLVGYMFDWPYDSIWDFQYVCLKGYFQFHILWQKPNCLAPKSLLSNYYCIKTCFK